MITVFLIAFIVILSLGLTLFFMFDYSEKTKIIQGSIFFEGSGFENLPPDTFTENDRKKLLEYERELLDIISNNTYSSQKRFDAQLEHETVKDRLHNPFQTGLPYEILEMLRDKEQKIEDLQKKGLTDNLTEVNINYDKQALVIFLSVDEFTLENIEKFDQNIRNYVGNEVNIIYKQAFVVTTSS